MSRRHEGELPMESSTYRAIREEGREYGRQEGRVEVLSKISRKLVEAKLGSLPPEAAEIDRMTEVEKLSRLVDGLIHAPDQKAMRRVLRSLEPRARPAPRTAAHAQRSRKQPLNNDGPPPEGGRPS